MAAMLSFKAKYMRPILEGSKIQTLRKSTRLRRGDLVAATCSWSRPPFALLEVEDVRQVRVAELDDALAHADGFEDVHDLRKALQDLYPDEAVFAAIRFRLVEPASGM